MTLAGFERLHPRYCKGHQPKPKQKPKAEPQTLKNILNFFLPKRMQLKIRHPSIREYLNYLPDSIKQKALEEGAVALDLYENLMDWEAESFSQALYFLLPIRLSYERYIYWEKVIETYENSQFELDKPKSRINKDQGNTQKRFYLTSLDPIYNNHSTTTES
tara:strand:+ start:1441 stop:1923 length:483 start_codon:yes stop_codon:yes gene_type:complete